MEKLIKARFNDKVCLVTGGGSGIGKATCIRLASEGGKVLILDINETHGQQSEEEIKKMGGEAVFVKTDIAISQSIKAAVDFAVKTYGKIDVVVNNAAIMTFNPILELEEHDWDRVMHVNLKSVFLFAKYSIPYMNRGAIVNISSVHAHETTANVIPYASSKGGIEAFTRGICMEIPAEKVRVNSVAPGAVDTPMLRNNPNILNHTENLEGPIARPEEIAAAICFLASEEASFINGATLIVDGGRLNKL